MDFFLPTNEQFMADCDRQAEFILDMSPEEFRREAQLEEPAKTPETTTHVMKTTRTRKVTFLLPKASE